MSPRNRIRIAIADDHAIVREGLKHILFKDPEVEIVAEACDSCEALEIGQDPRIQVLILDVSMPGRGGFDTLRQIRRRRPNLPVLMLSCYPEVEFALRALREAPAATSARIGLPPSFAAPFARSPRAGSTSPHPLLNGSPSRSAGDPIYHPMRTCLPSSSGFSVCWPTVGPLLRSQESSS